MSSASLLARLALVGGLLGALSGAGRALADDEAGPTFSGPRVFDMIPPTGIVGDGATKADLYFVALAPDGSPLTGLAFKTLLNTGAAGPLTDLGGGLWKMEYTPPKVDAKVTAELTLRGKIGKENVTETWSFDIVPSRTHQFAAAANPARMTLGVDKTASLSINLATGDRGGSAGVQLAISATVGTVDNLIDLGNGQFSALYTPPKELNAAVALLTIADKRDPGHSIGALAIPLAAKLELPVTAAPNTQVVVKIGEASFGPVPIDKKGKGKVPLLVPPGATGAEKLTVAADGSSVREPLDLKLPEARRVALVPFAAGIPADARLPVDIFAAVVTPDGRPDTAAPIVFSATAGSIGSARHLGNGVYSATFTPPTSATPTPMTVSAALGDSPIQKATSPVNLVAVRPEKVELKAEPATLPIGATSLKATAHVSGPGGIGIPGRVVTFKANGARPGKDPVKDLGNGDYALLLTPTGSGPVELSAASALPVTGDPAVRLIVVPARGRVPNDGLSSTLVSVAAVDEFGNPVPNTPVSLRITQGEGSLPAEVTTNAQGVAQVYYTAGRGTALIELEASTLSMKATGTLWQAPEEVKLPELPVAGARVEAGWVAAWRQTVGELRVERAAAP